MLPFMVWQHQYFRIVQDKEGTAVGRHVVWNLEGKFLILIIECQLQMLRITSYMLF